MAYRFTNTDKWNDCWFSSLKPVEKLLFNYLCDNCDIAGFIELNLKNWSSFIGTDKRTIEGALKGLQRGLLYSTEKDCIFIRNYLKHQKNLPLDPEKNPSHRGIIKRFNLYSQKFDIQDYTEFIKGASKGLSSPIGNGNGNGNTFIEPKKKFIYSEFYDSEIQKSGQNEDFIKIVKALHGENNLNIPLTVLLKMNTQLSFDQFQKLCYVKEKYKISIIQIFEKMQDWGNPKKRTTIYGSFQTFAKNQCPQITEWK